MFAIPLSRHNFREYDQMVTFYTRDQGKVSALARGVKKMVSKHAAYLEPYFLIDIELVPGKEVTHLTKVYPIELYRGIVDDLDKRTMLGYSIRVVDLVLAAEEKDVALFDMISSWLAFLHSTTPVAKISVDTFLLKLWVHLGYALMLEKCVVCGSQDVIGLSPKAGGLVCEGCLRDKEERGEVVYRLTVLEVKVLGKMMHDTFAEVNAWLLKEALPSLHEALAAFFQYHSSKPLPPWKI